MADELGQTAAPNHAILLLGPTGSGKTPLGDLLAERGFRQRRCVHFDFGANLRRLVQLDRPDGPLRREDLAFLKEVLRTGALLENEHFPIAERVLRWFLAWQAADKQTLVVLNGIPRHAGQAEALANILQVERVVALMCDAETVRQRIQSNVGGDRAERQDDDLESIQKKLELFRARTAPLLSYYQQRGVPVESLTVRPTMTPDHMWQTLDSGRPAEARE